MFPLIFFPVDSVSPALQSNASSSSSLMLNTQQLNINRCVIITLIHVILMSVLSVGACEIQWKLWFSGQVMVSFILLCPVYLDSWCQLTWFFSGVRWVTGTWNQRELLAQWDNVTLCLLSVLGSAQTALGGSRKCFLPPFFSAESSVVPV